MGGARTGLPDDWESLWGRPDEEPARLEWRRLKKISRQLAEQVPLVEADGQFGALVGSEELRSAPVHRWFTYKEGFSPALLGAVVDALDAGGQLNVADVFGGVATTALSGLVHPSVAEVRSVEYSPFARFAGQTKLLWPSLDPERLVALLEAALDYDEGRAVTVPQLSAFSNPEIFSQARIKALLRAREHLRELGGADAAERDFFLLGLAAVIEDLSGAMKDGRALRIKNARSRRASSLATTEPLIHVKGVVKRALAGQWSAMISDLRELQAQTSRLALAHHLAGDARHLDCVDLEDGSPAFPNEWATLSLFSPPYLNCIDYTELYKLELWLMEHVVDQGAFRQTRLGTLRSHPSVKFGPRPYFEGVEGPVRDLVDGLAEWISKHGARPEVGPVIRHYFEDMLQVWREQMRVLAPGSSAVCVVANSTFSRRDRLADGTRNERWRVPVLTDVILAKLAELVGFVSVEVWNARELRPRNVRGGRARESLIVARKPDDRRSR